MTWPWPWGRGRAKRARTAAELERELDRLRRSRNWAVAELLAGGPRRPSAGWWAARRGEVAARDLAIARLVLATAAARRAESRRTSRPAETIDTL